MSGDFLCKLGWHKEPDYKVIEGEFPCSRCGKYIVGKKSKSLLCKFGIHKWSNVGGHGIMHSHVVDYWKTCVKCHKKVVWNTPVDD